MTPLLLIHFMRALLIIIHLEYSRPKYFGICNNKPLMPRTEINNRR